MLSGFFSIESINFCFVIERYKPVGSLYLSQIVAICLEGKSPWSFNLELNVYEVMADMTTELVRNGNSGGLN